mmetsp:Transcript_3652/g.11385  ORF Transcript_3652/g.11385 Transcript_3652/m.11385 type:complete len:296 (-) Transcript_3652:77-964(-)
MSFLWGGRKQRAQRLAAPLTGGREEGPAAARGIAAPARRRRRRSRPRGCVPGARMRCLATSATSSARRPAWRRAARLRALRTAPPAPPPSRWRGGRRVRPRGARAAAGRHARGGTRRAARRSASGGRMEHGSGRRTAAGKLGRRLPSSRAALRAARRLSTALAAPRGRRGGRRRAARRSCRRRVTRSAAAPPIHATREQPGRRPGERPSPPDRPPTPSRPAQATQIQSLAEGGEAACSGEEAATAAASVALPLPTPLRHPHLLCSSLDGAAQQTCPRNVSDVSRTWACLSRSRRR